MCIHHEAKSHLWHLETAAHFAAESSTGTNVEVVTTDDFTKSVDALVYEIDEAKELTKIAYPIELFDRNIIDGRAMIASFLTLTIGNNQGMGDVEYGKLHDFYIHRRCSACSTAQPRPSRICGACSAARWSTAAHRRHHHQAEARPKPEPFAKACYDFWLGGDFIKNDEPQGNQVFSPFRETVIAVRNAMVEAQNKTGEAKLFSFNITADYYGEMIARGEYILENFGENADHVAFLVDGYVAGPAAITTARRYFPRQYLHYHPAGHGAVTSPNSKRGYTAFVLSKMARMQGASGIHTGTMGFGKMEGEAADRNIAHMITDDSAEGPYYRQEWLGFNPTTPIISGGMNALRMPGFFNNLGHSNLIMTAGGGAFGHVDGGAAGAISLRQAEQCWRAKADPIEFARNHREFARAFLSFPNDADKLFPGWRDKLASAIV